MKCIRCGNESGYKHRHFCNDCYRECDPDELAMVAKLYYSEHHDEEDESEGELLGNI